LEQNALESQCEMRERNVSHMHRFLEVFEVVRITRVHIHSKSPHFDSQNPQKCVRRKKTNVHNTYNLGEGAYDLSVRLIVLWRLLLRVEDSHSTKSARVICESADKAV
jgi:hypothetical protein